MGRFQNSARNTGTSTTETPVRKADFEGVVYCSPTVCSSFPINKKIAHHATGAHRSHSQTWKLAIKNDCQHHRRQAHADGIEEQRRNIRQRILDDGEIRSPDQRDQDQKNVRFEGTGHEYRVANARASLFVLGWGRGLALSSHAVYQRFSSI